MNPFETRNPRDVELLAYVLFVTVLDRLVTVQHFHLESNRAVSMLGPEGWVVFTGLLVLLLLVTCISVDFGRYAWVRRVCLWFLATVTLLAVVSNWIVSGGLA